jgi:hypothetical protein
VILRKKHENELLGQIHVRERIAGIRDHFSSSQDFSPVGKLGARSANQSSAGGAGTLVQRRGVWPSLLICLSSSGSSNSARCERHFTLKFCPCGRFRSLTLLVVAGEGLQRSPGLLEDRLTREACRQRDQDPADTDSHQLISASSAKIARSQTG